MFFRLVVRGRTFPRGCRFVSSKLLDYFELPKFGFNRLWLTWLPAKSTKFQVSKVQKPNSAFFHQINDTKQFFSFDCGPRTCSLLPPGNVFDTWHSDLIMLVCHNKYGCLRPYLPKCSFLFHVMLGKLNFYIQRTQCFRRYIPVNAF